MKKRKLYFKDISGLRFIGAIFIFTYVVSYILFSQESTSVNSSYIALIASVKNLCISLFFIISAFLLSAHGLREYKYTNNFNIKKFFYRRFLRIAPTFTIALIFYFFIHPAIVNILQLTPLDEIGKINQLVFFRKYQFIISREVYIYLFFIYGIFIILQYYVLHGLILKFFRSRFKEVMIALLIMGLIYKVIFISEDFASYLYLPYYLMEIAIGSLTAAIMREESNLISTIKTMSRTRITLIYNITIFSTIAIYMLASSPYLYLFAKVSIYFIVGFYILEQTFAKHSLFKARNSQFVIQFGNISYSFILFAPIVSVTMLILIESIELDIKSRIVLLIYPLACFLITWLLSSVYHNNIERFFEQIRKEHRTV